MIAGHINNIFYIITNPEVTDAEAVNAVIKDAADQEAAV